MGLEGWRKALAFGSEKFSCVYLDVDIVQLQTKGVNGDMLSPCCIRSLQDIFRFPNYKMQIYAVVKPADYRICSQLLELHVPNTCNILKWSLLSQDMPVCMDFGQL